MSTKRAALFFAKESLTKSSSNNQQTLYGGLKNNDQFNNINLNQNYKNEDAKLVQSDTSTHFTTKKAQNYNGGLDNLNTKNVSKTWNKNDSSQMKNGYQWHQNAQKYNNNNSNNSTLSLHIEAYENSVNESQKTVASKSPSISSSKGGESQIQYRNQLQLDGDIMAIKPEMMQFKSSQKMHTLNVAGNQRGLEMLSKLVQTSQIGFTQAARFSTASAEAKQHSSSFNVTKCPWYWGAISSRDAEHLLSDKPSGTFLIRDSESPNHIFALSHRTSTKTYHSRIPRHNGYYCLGGPQAMVRSSSLVDLVKQIIECSKNNERTKILMHPSENIPMAETVSLIEPLDRIQMLPCLKYLCRLKIRQSLSDFRQVPTLPLPDSVKKYLLSKKYLYVHFSKWEEEERSNLERLKLKNGTSKKLKS